MGDGNLVYPDVCGEATFWVETDLGGGFVPFTQLGSGRRQAAQDIRSSEGHHHQCFEMRAMLSRVRTFS